MKSPVASAAKMFLPFTKPTVRAKSTMTGVSVGCAMASLTLDTLTVSGAGAVSGLTTIDDSCTVEAVLPTVNVMVFVPASLDFQIASLFVPLKAPVLAVIFLVAVVSLIAKLPLALIKCISERSSVEVTVKVLFL